MVGEPWGTQKKIPKIVFLTLAVLDREMCLSKPKQDFHEVNLLISKCLTGGKNNFAKEIREIVIA